MVIVAVILSNYTISVTHLVNLAAEYCGVPATKNGIGSASTIEFKFDGTSAPANARGFRRVLDTGFRKQSAPGAEVEGGEREREREYE